MHKRIDILWDRSLTRMLMGGVFFLLLISMGCSSVKSTTGRQQKAIEQRKEAHQEEVREKYNAKMERHSRMQSAQGQEQLRRAQEHSRRLDARQGKRKSWFSRLFSKEEPG